MALEPLHDVGVQHQHAAGRQQATMAGGRGLNRSSSRGQLPPQELLDDLCSRFILNVPKEELESFERILFLLEQAHWFYEDNSVEHNPNLKSLSFKDFTSLMFKSCTALRPYIAHLDDIYKDFNNYKFRVPVSGAIILDDTYERCLLVKGWKAGASWSFPRGKRNKDEEDHTCAVREVLEETGCDVSTFLYLDDYIEVSIGQQRVRLYIITGVKRDTVFAPQTKKEISEISWHRIDELLPASDDAVSRALNGMKLYMVAPFLTGLNAWIATHPPPLHQKLETSTRGFFGSPLGHVWFPQGLERIRPRILLNFIRPCIAGIHSGQEWPQPNGPLPILAKITKWVGQDYPFCAPYQEQRNIHGLGKVSRWSGCFIHETYGEL